MLRTPEVGSGNKISRRRFIGLTTGGVVLTAAGLLAGIKVAEKTARDKSGSGLPSEGSGAAAGKPPSLGELTQAGIKQSQEGVAGVAQPADTESNSKSFVAPYLAYYDNPGSSKKDSYVRFYEIDRPGPILLAATEGPTWYARPALKKELESLAGRPITDQEIKEIQTSQQKSIGFLTRLYQEGKISQQALEFYSQTPDQLLQQAKEQFPRYFP